MKAWTDTLRSAALAAALVLLAGCATVYEGGYQRSEGWRRGGVVETVDGGALERPTYWTCTRGLSREQREAKSFVLVWYVEGKYKNYYVASAAPAHSFVAGQAVFVNVRRCDDALVARNAG